MCSGRVQEIRADIQKLKLKELQLSMNRFFWNLSVFFRHPLDVLKVLWRQIRTSREIILDKELVIPFDNQQIIGNPVNSGIAYEIFRRGIWEFTTTKKFKSSISSGMCVVDVGGATGYFTLLAARRVESQGRVVTFEPIPNQMELLKRNVDHNGYSNVTISSFGLFDHNRTIVLEKPGKKSRLAAQKSEPSQEDILIECRKFDLLREEMDLPKVDLIKMDIEGAELSALKGMRQTLTDDKPIIILEIHPENLGAFGHNIGDLLSFLKGLSYEVHPIDCTGKMLRAVAHGDAKDNIHVCCMVKSGR